MPIRLYTNAQNRFCWILRHVLREMSIASATSAGSPRISVMPAAACATSVPVAIAMPMSAAASAGASLMPSPAIATMPALRHLQIADHAGLVVRQHLRVKFVDAERLRDARRAARGCRRSRARFSRPLPRACATAARAVGLTVSPNAISASATGRRPDRTAATSQDTVLPAAFELAGARGRLAADVRCPVLRASAPLPSAERCGRRRRASTPAAGHGACVAARSALAPGLAASYAPDDGPRERMIALALHGGGERRALHRGDHCRPVSNAVTDGCPMVSVPVLSNATTFTRCAVSSASASLISTPWRAATPVPAMIAVGVASPSAHGQAITSTATAFRMRRLAAGAAAAASRSA